MISLRIRPEIYHVLKKYSDGKYQVVIRALITKYAKRLVATKAPAETVEQEFGILQQFDEE